MIQCHHGSCPSSSLHAIDHNPIHTGFRRNFDVFLHPARRNLNKYRDSSFCNISQLLDFKNQIISPEDISMSRVAVQVDTLWELPELSDLFGDFSGHEVPGQSWFCSDPHDNLECIGCFNVSQGETDPARQDLHHLLVGVGSLFWQQSPFPVVDRGPHD